MYARHSDLAEPDWASGAGVTPAAAELPDALGDDASLLAELPEVLR